MSLAFFCRLNFFPCSHISISRSENKLILLWNRGWLPPPFPFIFASFTASFCKPIGKGNKCERKKIVFFERASTEAMGPILHAVHLFRSHALYIHRALLSPIKMHASPQLFACNSNPNHQVWCTRTPHQMRLMPRLLQSHYLPIAPIDYLLSTTICKTKTSVAVTCIY